MNVIQKISNSTIILLLFASIANGSVSSITQQKKKMENIAFIPKEFNEIKLGYDETDMVKTSPGYPKDVIKVGIIAINTPKVIHYDNNNNNCKPILPISAVHSISGERSAKYIKLADQLIHVRNMKNGIEFSGKIYKKRNPDISEFPISLYSEKDRIEREELLKAAQKYTDEEIDYPNSFTIGDYINVDIMEYVDFPFLPGKYEIWLSFSGLESNHTIVEIIKRK